MERHLRRSDSVKKLFKTLIGLQRKNFLRINIKLRKLTIIRNINEKESGLEGVFTPIQKSTFF